MGSRELSRGRRVVARLPHGGDLPAEIAAAADEHGMTTAEVRAIGALSEGRLAFYHQETRAYGELDVDGACVGGHVVPGCRIFACELILQELVGEPLERGYEEVTGLPLWRGLYPASRTRARRCCGAGRAEEEKVVSEGGLEPP
jgi:uncharacterized protein